MQLDAPPERRGRFVGAAGMTGQGFQAGSGILIGLLASGLGVAGGIAVAAAALIVVTTALLIVVLVRRRVAPSIDPNESGPIQLNA